VEGLFGFDANRARGLGFEFYNLFQHPSFGLPDNDMSNPSFGKFLIQRRRPPAECVLGAEVTGLPEWFG
jgi:hypothetical protein